MGSGMPYMIRLASCKVCGQPNKLTRNRWNKQNNCWYLQTTCKDCERARFKKYQQEHKDYFNSYNKAVYLKSVGSYTWILNRTEEEKKQRARDKSNRRCTRAKQARREDEFTKFVYAEAHELRKMRNKTTGIEWHVDHIIPLVSNLVCGLHVWNNFAVIPKVENLRKGNYHSVHD